MHRPDHSTADPDGISSGVAGYTEGNPLAAPPEARTIVTKDQANEWTEGLCRLVEGVGYTLVKNNFDQITTAVQMHAALPALAKWSTRSAAGAYAGTFHAVAYSGAEFFAVGASGEIQRSSYGDSWSNNASPGSHTRTYRDVCDHNGVPYAVNTSGSGGSVDYNSSGSTWAVYQDGTANDEDFYCIASDGTDLVYGGEDKTSGNVPFIYRTGVAETFDGGVSSQRIMGMACDGSEFVALGLLGSGGHELMVKVGSDWTVQSTGAQVIDRVIWDSTNEQFIAVGPATIKTSPDGATWTTQTGALAGGTKGTIGVWRTLLVHVRDSEFGQWSLDAGVTWQRVDPEVSGTYQAIASDSRRMVIVGSSGLIAVTNRAIF